MKPLARLLYIGIFIIVLALYMGLRLVTDDRIDFFQSFFRSPSNEVLFVGDVMLARSVETRIKDVGEQHFFDQVRPLHERAKYVVGNFEAVIPETHTQTPDFTFHFSVDSSFIPMLARTPFTHFTLANNHANDFGAAARENTIKVLRNSGITPFGSPNEIASTSVTYLDLDTKRIALVGFQTVTKTIDISALDRMIEDAKVQSDIQIAVIHWGEEYQLVHSAIEEQLARHLVEQGIDAIIGHHPHVVQDVGRIDGVPVFYSLGNYVFDQYFDTEVENGLAVTMSISDSDIENELLFDLIPVQTRKSVPRLMDEKEGKVFLKSLAARSEESVRSDIIRSTIKGTF